MKKVIYIIILVAAICIPMFNLRSHGGNHHAGSYSASGAGEELQQVVTNPALEEQIIRYKGMVVSFNPRLHIPNWVAWELTGEEAQGEEPRSDNFAAVESVPG